MGKKALSLVLIGILIFGTIGIGFCENKNLSRKEVEKIIEGVATKRGIPSVILKSIAKVESSFAQFNKDGKPKISRGGHIGIMQVSGRSSGYDLKRLKDDPVYNIEVGADMLLSKWRIANSKMPQIGDMDPNILEHWYFALWAYNGLSERNNPNVGKGTYQDKIYGVALKEYKQKITPISRGSITKRGVPKNDIKIKTPKDYHEGDIIKYSPEDRVKIDGKNFLVLYNEPSGKEIDKIKGNITMTILEGPVLNKGFYFYKIKVEEDSRTGWIFGNWLSKVENKE